MKALEYADEIGILVANGPSLRHIDIPFLQNRTSLGANGVFMLGAFTPTYYFATDRAFLKAREAEVKDMIGKTTVLIRKPWHLFFEGCLPFNRVQDHVFSPVANDFVGAGGSITFVMLQFAYWMGFRHLLIVGLDHDYFTGGIPDHFDDKYTEGIDHPMWDKTPKEFQVYWANQRDLVNASYQIARETFEEDGRRIFNLTPDSQCNIFERDRIENWIS